MVTKFKGQRINGWTLGVAIWMWICFAINFKEPTIFATICLVVAVILTKISFEDVE